jgi:hypothetical protein
MDDTISFQRIGFLPVGKREKKLPFGDGRYYAPKRCQPVYRFYTDCGVSAEDEGLAVKGRGIKIPLSDTTCGRGEGDGEKKTD